MLYKSYKPLPAAPVRFSALPEFARNKFVEVGCPIKLQCEVSEPTAQVLWHKDGEQLLQKSEYQIQTKENLRVLIIESAEVRHSGVYSCEAADDHIEFKVDVAGDLRILSFVRITNVFCLFVFFSQCLASKLECNNEMKDHVY